MNKSVQNKPKIFMGLICFGHDKSVQDKAQNINF